MVDFLFTIDYEIYGDGTGSLQELVFEPARQLKALFAKRGLRFVNFTEAVELQKIEEAGSDPWIDQVKKQIREFHRDGFEIALHLHPQWANACYEKGQWRLDLSEYNLCTLPKSRIAEIVNCALAYLRGAVHDGSFSPIAFRAGNWLFQPTQAAAAILADRGLRIDSSVFKGGVQRIHRLNYQPARKNGYYWRFTDDVNELDWSGTWIEMPIHTEMVPLWRIATAKRMAYRNQIGAAKRSMRETLGRISDFVRLLYPLKLDFCRMTVEELTAMVGKVLRADRSDPETYRPIVAIGHTKDLTDFQTVESFLDFLADQQVQVVTFSDIYPKLASARAMRTPIMSAALQTR